MRLFAQMWGRRTGLVLILSAPAWWVLAWAFLGSGLFDLLFAMVGFVSLFSGLHLTAWLREAW